MRVFAGVGASIRGFLFGAELSIGAPALVDCLKACVFNLTCTVSGEIILILFLMDRSVSDLRRKAPAVRLEPELVRSWPMSALIEVLGRRFLTQVLWQLSAAERVVSVGT